MFIDKVMTKLHLIPPSLTSLSPSLSRHEPARRLIVLVPNLESDYIPAIRRIWELANTQDANVQFLALCKDTRQELSLRRVLATMSMMVQDGKISTEVRVAIGTSWVDVVKHNYQAGDMIVCFAEQRAGLLQKPLSQILESNLAIPVYIVSGGQIPKPESNWLAQVTTSLGFVGIITGFGLLQVKIMQVSEGWFQIILLILAVISEIWLIWVWDSRFR